MSDDFNPRGKKEKKETSLLLGYLRRLNNILTPNVIGWIWAANCIAILIQIFFTDTGTIWHIISAAVCFMVAVVFWIRSDRKKGNY